MWAFAYYSFTGKSRRFAEKLTNHFPLVDITQDDLPAGTTGVVLLTPTYGLGNIPKPVTAFLDTHSELLRGVVAAGNTNFTRTYAQAGKTVAHEYQVPLVRIIDYAGTQADADAVIQWKEEVSPYEQPRNHSFAFSPQQ